MFPCEGCENGCDRAKTDGVLVNTDGLTVQVSIEVCDPQGEASDVIDQLQDLIQEFMNGLEGVDQANLETLKIEGPTGRISLSIG